MLRAFETNDNYDYSSSPYGCNKVLVTPEQLNNSYSSSSTGSSNLFVKPLQPENSNRDNTNVPNIDPIGRSFEIENDLTPQSNRLPSYESMISRSQHGKIRIHQDESPHRVASPSKLHHINRSNFSRNSNLRRSLGGASVGIPIQDDQDDLDDNISSPRDGITSPKPMLVSPSGDSSILTKSPKPPSRSDLHPESTIQTFRVVDLPSLDDMGLSLEPYHDSNTGTFLGVRIWDKFRDINYQPSNRNRCPFRSGDVIVGVNQHHLSGMYESSAIRCVRDAFREARTYTVEFGVIRSPSNVIGSSSRSRMSTIPSTFPRRLSRLDITAFDWDKPCNLSSEMPSAHQPRRRIETPTSNTPNSHLSSRNSFIQVVSNTSNSTSPTASSNTVVDGQNKLNRLSQRSKPALSSYPPSQSHNFPPYSECPESLTPDRPSTPNYNRQSMRSCHTPVETTKSLLSPDTFHRSGLRTSSKSGINSPKESRRKSTIGPTIRELNAFNTRTIGQKILIELTKMDVGGLGFTLASRDTQTVNPGCDPVYVKKILPTGAAILDGRLMVGDRLLSVDGVDTCTLDQVLGQLRSVPAGQVVQLIVSRQVSGPSEDSSKPAREDLPPRYYTEHTYTYNVPPTTSVSKETPCLGVNFKWYNDIPASVYPKDSSDQYAPVPGLYVEGFLPGGLISNGSTGINGSANMIRIGDHLVRVNTDNLVGLQSKDIVSKLRTVLLECQRMDSSGNFTLSVRRYHKRPRPSSIQTTSSPSVPKIAVDSSEPDHRSKELNRRQSPSLSNESNSDSNSGRWVAMIDSRHRSLSRQNSFNETSSPKAPKSNLNRYSVIGDLFVHSSTLDTDNEDLSCTNGVMHQFRNMSVPPRQSYFTREGFGRRSVSEKRHGHLEASQFSFYQTNVLPNRYRMPEDVDKQYSTMPTTRRLKMHKARMAAAAASGTVGMTGPGPLKALHPSETYPDQLLITKQSSERSPRRDSPPKTSTTNTDHHLLRNRKQNSSFRHAVDRSFNTDSTSHPTTTPTNNRDLNVPQVVDVWSNFASSHPYSNLSTNSYLKSEDPLPVSNRPRTISTHNPSNPNPTAHCLAPSPPPRNHSRSRVRDSKSRIAITEPNKPQNHADDYVSTSYHGLSNSHHDSPSSSQSHSHRHRDLRDKPESKRPNLEDPGPSDTPHSSRSNSTQNSLRDSSHKNRLSALKGLFRRSTSKSTREHLSPHELVSNVPQSTNPKLDRRLSVPDYHLITKNTQNNTSRPHSRLHPISSLRIPTNQIMCNSSDVTPIRTGYLNHSNSCDSDALIRPQILPDPPVNKTKSSKHRHCETTERSPMSPPPPSNYSNSPAIPPRIRRSEIAGQTSFGKSTSHADRVIDVPSRSNRKLQSRPLPALPFEQVYPNNELIRSNDYQKSVDIMKRSKARDPYTHTTNEHSYPATAVGLSIESSNRKPRRTEMIERSVRSPPTPRTSSHRLVSSGYQINSTRENHNPSRANNTADPMSGRVSRNKSQGKISGLSQNLEPSSTSRHKSPHHQQAPSQRLVSSDLQTPNHYPTLPNRTYRHETVASPSHHLSRSASRTRNQVAPHSLSRELPTDSIKAKQIVTPTNRR